MNVLVLTGGGTAGHVTPSLALLPELKKRFDKIVYVGSKNGIERELAKKEGLTYFYVPTAKLQRKFTIKNTLLPAKLLFAISESKKLLKNIQPSVVFSKGGYVALPVVIASKKLGIPVVSHESDITVGLANKIGAKYSELFLTSFDSTVANCKKTIFTGSPIRESLFYNYDKRQILKKYGFSGRRKILLIFGGSSGSQSINEITKKCLYRLINRYDVIHVCGKGKGDCERERGYLKIPYADDIGELFYIADLVVSRAGANSLFELTALKKPTLAIPLPKGNSRGDQIDNAEYFKKRKMIEVLPEEGLNENTFINSIFKLENQANDLIENCTFQYQSLPNERIAELIKKVSLQG